MTPTIAPAFRPFTSTLPSSALDVIRYNTPAHTEEHLVQGWDALSMAGGATDPAVFDRSIRLARRRLEGAQSALPRVKGRARWVRAAEEVGHFARLIAGTR